MNYKAILYYLIGPSYSGKSTWAQERADSLKAVVVSSDAIRAKLWGDESIQREPEKVFNEMRRNTEYHLSQGTNVIYDATNLKVGHRINFLDQIKKIKDIKKVAILFTPELSVLLDRQKHRSRFVSEEVIKKQIRSFDPPYYGEGWDSILCMDFPENKNLEDFFQENYDEPHDNPHHSLSIGEHMETCWRIANHITEGKLVHPALFFAARYHDIGKFFTKTFTNMKGETTEIAHYYDHENVGAYFILNYYTGPNRLMVAALVRYHMAPYHYGEKKLKQLKRILGEQMYSLLLTLHECDKAAH